MDLWITLANASFTDKFSVSGLILLFASVCWFVSAIGEPDSPFVPAGVGTAIGGLLLITSFSPYPDFVTENVTTYLAQEHHLNVIGEATYDKDDQSVAALVERPDGTTTIVTVTWLPLKSAPDSVSEVDARLADLDPITLTFTAGKTTTPEEPEPADPTNAPAHEVTPSPTPSS